MKAVNPAYETLGEPSVSLDDIRRFRQLDSKCPGHPEYRWTAGVECTTGPLGTGYATSVGMAMASKWEAATFNRPGFELFDFDVYAVGGDGCMMEGVAQEAASLAGHLQLDNLCWIYDNNEITIEGSTALAFSDDVATQFISLGWNVTRVGDANDRRMLARAFDRFRAERNRPTLIIVDSRIAYGAPDQGGHPRRPRRAPGRGGDPRRQALLRLARGRARSWSPTRCTRTSTPASAPAGGPCAPSGRQLFARYAEQYPELADQLDRMQRRDLPEDWDADDPRRSRPTRRAWPGREANGRVLNAVAQRVPWLVGGASDLGPSTKTRLTFDGAGDFSAAEPAGRNLHFGVREHAAGCIANGLALCKVRPYQAGFLIFSDFQRGAIRLSALMELPVIHVFTHDSIGVGEDGPTHQPVEQLASLRAMPGLIDIRPATPTRSPRPGGC